MRFQTITYDELTLRLLMKGEKQGSALLRKVARYAAQSLNGGFCPECGAGGEHDPGNDGYYYQCINRECNALWHPGENAPRVDEFDEDDNSETWVDSRRRF